LGAGAGAAFAAALAGFFLARVVGWRLFEFLNHHGSRVRHLFSGQQKDLFANDLGYEEALRLVRDLVCREVALALRQYRDDLVQEYVQPFLLARGDGHDLGERVLLAPVSD
jgi:hypothetical protein